VHKLLVEYEKLMDTKPVVRIAMGGREGRHAVLAYVLGCLKAWIT